MSVTINNGIKRNVQNIRVFYNEDCGKYGVQTFGNLYKI